MTTITLHGFAGSTYTRTARMAAVEKGVAHELVPIAYGKPEHLALHPFGKMPVLTHGGRNIFETLAICAYLDAAFEGPRLLPEGMDLARALGGVSVAVDYAYRAVVHTGRSDEGFDPEDMATAAKVFDLMEAKLEGGAFLAGGAVSVADLFLAPMLAYHVGQAGDGHVFAGRPRLDRWFRDMSARASFRETEG